MDTLEDTYLAKDILTRCGRIDLYATEIVETDRDTKRFMAEYCDTLEPYLEEIRQLDTKLRALRATSTAKAPRESNITLASLAPKSIQEPAPATFRTPKAHSLYGELRKLYRTLARDFHPDIQSVCDDTIKALNDAYSHQRLGSLWHIAFSSAWKQPTDEMEAGRHAMLRLYDKKTKHALHVVQSHLLALQHSTDYQLKERSYLAMLEGHDFTGDIIDELAEEIAQKQRRITYLELTAPMRDYRKEVASSQ